MHEVAIRLKAWARPGGNDRSRSIYAAGVGAYGVAIQAGGAMVNGSATSRAAVISGYGGVLLSDAYSPGAQGTLTNFGTIEGVGAGDNAFGGPFSGVYVESQGAIINGAASDPVALIEGYEGIKVYTTAPLSVTNFGVIDGEGGVAVQFKSASDALIVEAGCSFVGQVLGAGGTLDLASGTGTITSLFAAGGNITVSGSLPTTTFQNFGALMVGAGASFSDRTTVTIAAGQSVIDAGTLTLKGAVRNGGTLEADGGVLTVMGAVSGKGVALVNGGTLDLAGAVTQSVTFAGSSGTLELGQSQGYTGTITGFSTSGGTLLDLSDIAFVSAGEATFSGTTSGGVLTVTDGTHTAKISLVGDYLGSTFVAAGDGHGGVLIHDPRAPAGQGQAFVAAMAGLAAAGGGTVVASSVRADRPPLLVEPRGGGGNWA